MAGAKLTKWNGDAILAALERGAAKGLEATAGIIVGHAKRLAPVGVSGGSGLRGHINYQRPRKEANRWHCYIGFTGEPSKIFYGVVMERGRRAGAKAPPSRMLELWIKRKLGVKKYAFQRIAAGGRIIGYQSVEQQIRSLSFVIARAIGRRGIKPRRFLGRAYDANIHNLPRLTTNAVRIELEKLAKIKRASRTAMLGGAYSKVGG